ncbi:MAG: YkgJ family cysteine cluster protein [Thermodesulfobacteriota bacterium]|nr:YkgJ family cysteine cluster protein [Thermodesulfobacteriota bacterium]
MEDIFKPLKEKTFHFSCHKGIPCFTVCCAKLNLILTPYDILRIKNRLGLSSDDFLDDYTETVVENNNRFPTVRLKMKTDEEEACPFVTEQGCAIYEDRPSACRLYPLGRASTMVNGQKNAREKFFVVAESHCLGLQEKKSWALDDWLDHEDVNGYSAMNDQWLEIVTSSKDIGTSIDPIKKYQMFFMASYNLDNFRKFLFKSRFFDLFDVAADLKKEIEGDDVALMKFGFKWLKFSLFGDKGLQPKSHTAGL